MTVIAIFYTLYAPVYLQALWVPVEGKRWMMLFWVFSLPLFSHTSLWNALESPVMGLVVAYLVVTLIWFALSSQSDIPGRKYETVSVAILEIVSFLLIFSKLIHARLARKNLGWGGYSRSRYSISMKFSFLCPSARFSAIQRVSTAIPLKLGKHRNLRYDRLRHFL